MNVRIRQCYRRSYKKCKLSGHEWTEDTLLNKWEVVGMVGVVATCRSFEKAVILRDESQAFYDKFFS